MSAYNNHETKLLDYIDQNQAQKAMLRKVQWADGGCCPVCGWERPDHADECELATLLSINLERCEGNRVFTAKNMQRLGVLT